MAQPRRTREGQEQAQSAQPTTGVNATLAPEPHPGPDIEQVLDAIFLTPRVVDQRGFEELAGSLRGLARDAAAQNRTLQTTSAEVDRLSDSLRQATQELHARLETAARLMPTLDARVQKAEGLIDQTGAHLDDRLREIKSIASDDFKIDRERIAQRVREEVSGVVAKLIEEQLRDGRQRLVDAGAAELARVRGELDAMTAKAAQARAEIAKAADHAAKAAVERVTNDAASLLERVDQSRGALADALAAANDQAATIFEKTRAGLEDLAVVMSDRCEQIATQARDAAETALARARDFSRGVESSCDAAELRLGAVADRVAERVQACSEQAVEAALAAKAIEGELREGAEKTARTAVLSVREQIGDVLAGAHEDLRRAREAALDTLEQAGSSLDDQARRVRDEITLHTASCVERVRPLLDQAEEASLSLGAAREVIEQINERAGTSIAELRADLDDAIKVAARRIEQASQGPAALIESLHAAHARVGDELAQTAASIEACAQRAARQRFEIAQASEQVESRLRGLDLGVIVARLTEVLERSTRVEALAQDAAQAAAHADTALKNLESYRAQAEHARRQLGDAIVSGASKVDTIEADIDALKARVDAIRAEANAPVSPLTPQMLGQAHELGARLAQIVAQADLMGQGLSELLRQAKAVQDSANAPPAKPAKSHKPAKPTKPKAP